MSVMSKVGAGAVLAVAAYALLTYNTRADDGVRQVKVRLVAVWETNRDHTMTWTANGEHPPPEVDRVSPWERIIRVRVGGTVTFTVTPSTGGAGAHHCIIEHPPGRPLPGTAQRTGHGTTPIMCTAVIGA